MTADPEAIAQRLGSDEEICQACVSHISVFYLVTRRELEGVLPFRAAPDLH